jgi:hypothetical protein
MMTSSDARQAGARPGPRLRSREFQEYSNTIAALAL